MILLKWPFSAAHDILKEKFLLTSMGSHPFIVATALLFDGFNIGLMELCDHDFDEHGLQLIRFPFRAWFLGLVGSDP